MIQRLQLKFVLICMGSLLVVLALIIAGMNIVSYRGVVQEADELLTLLTENKGHFPSMGGPADRLPPHMSPEVPFETRYFSVTIDSETGKVLQADTGRIAAIDTAEAIEHAQNAKADHGFSGQYRYMRRMDGQTERLVFLDCGRRLDAWTDFLIASISISAAGYLLVFALVLFLSNRVARPFAESYEKQKQFITDAGHELKTPLTIIQADADVLEMELGKNEWLEDIQKQTRRLSDLTADLVFLSKMEEAQASLPMIEFPLSDVVAEAAQSFAALAQTRGKELTVDIAPMLSLRGNEKAIAQLTSILMDNALKYSPQNARIELRLEKQGRSILLSVTNPSCQSLPKQLSQLFDRFYRGDSARTAQGFGIGLSMARAIVNAHGGKITASPAGENTLRITAQLPAGTAL